MPRARTSQGRRRHGLIGRLRGAVVLAVLALGAATVTPAAAAPPSSTVAASTAETATAATSDTAVASPSSTRHPRPLPRSSAGRRLFLVEATSSKASAVAVKQVRRAGGTVTRRYGTVITGFAATLTVAQARALRTHAGIRTVTRDRAIVANPCLGCPPESLSREAVANWGLLRLSSRTAVTLEPQEPNGPVYRYDSDGEGVTAFVLDSGITAGGELQSDRVRPGRDFVGGSADAACRRHGTHVADIIGGDVTGVADRVSLVPLRVFACSGQGRWSNVIAALDWAVTHRPHGPAVVNLSGSSAAFTLGDRAVRATIAHGLPVVVSAGNAGRSACRYSPARVPAVLTVASTGIDDRLAPSSNAGPCVDLLAPGVDIATTDGAVSGTSFAAAHVTGAVARYLENHRSASPAAVAQYLRAQATRGVVPARRGAPDRLLYLPAPVPPGGPRSVGWSKDDNANTITATWSPPAQVGSAHLTNYGVCFNASNVITQFPGPVCSYTSATARTLTIGGGRDGVSLEDDGIYTVYVVAVSKAGSGLSGSTDIRLAPALPVAPGLTATVDEEAGGILLFVTPVEQYGTGPITAYRWTRDGVDQDGNGPVSVTTDTTNSFYEFTNLVHGQTYHFSVALVTAAGAGAEATVTATYPG
ncbi:S8 family serine peptidase [uncultured Friedmanniella sp.]|uniref:S8 family serine peptidase n=1 Tax=uncultured Friedmanniella sp. TaxID=335381 RepID=UPI0035CAB671